MKHQRKCKAKNQKDKCIFYEKIHSSKSAADNHIKAIKKRGGRFSKTTKNGKIVVKYSFVKSQKEKKTTKKRTTKDTTPKITINQNINIPKTTRERREFLKIELQKFRGKKYKCPALSNADVFVTADSIKEISAHACKSRKSTIMALYLDKMIKNAVFIRTSTPKAGTQTKRFKFIKLFVLETDIKNFGKAKLTVGVRRSGKHVQYCITAK